MAEATNIFNFDWDAPVSDEARDRLFEKIVGVVRRWRLEVPAVLFLEVHAPLSHLAGQGAVAFSPFLAPLLPGGIQDVQRISKLLETPENLHLLIRRITESGSEEMSHAARQR